MTAIYISIGNSDDKLTQARWSQFWVDVASQVISRASATHGSWFSNPTCPWQNAYWCVEFPSEAVENDAREAASELAREYGQDSIAWATATTEFL